MLQDFPEEPFGQDRVALSVGVGEVVATGRGGAAQGGQRPGVQLQGITHIVQANAVAQLSLRETDHVTPRREGAYLFVHPGLPG